MRFNDKALAELSNQYPVIEGRLHHKKLSSANYSHSGFKERWFKLVSNMLFYFNLSDTGAIETKRPVGAFVLENSTVQYEGNGETAFAFCVIFKDEIDKKHVFSGRSEDYVLKWVMALKESSYEYWRSKLLRLQYRISKVTGEDPLLMFPRNNTNLLHRLSREDSTETSPDRTEHTSQKSSFQSYINDNTTNCAKKRDMVVIAEDNLLKFEENHFGPDKRETVGLMVKLRAPPARPPRSPRVTRDTSSDVTVGNLIDL